MDRRSSTLKASVAVIACCLLLYIDDVTTLPLQLCRPLINYVDSLASSGQSVPADHLHIYVDCLRAQSRQFKDNSAVRQLLELQQTNSTTGAIDDVQTAVDTDTWSLNVPKASDDLCVTVECLGRRAGFNFEPCARLTQTQCTALVNVLEHITSDAENNDNNDVDEDNIDAAARLFERFRVLVTQYQKWRQNHMISAEQLAETENEMTNQKYKTNAESRSKTDKSSRMTSSQVTSGARSARRRRAATARVPFRLPRRMTPETRAIIQAYLEWRKKNGYGRISGRWG